MPISSESEAYSAPPKLANVSGIKHLLILAVESNVFNVFHISDI